MPFLRINIAIGSATARVARVRTLPIVGNLTCDPLKIVCQKLNINSLQLGLYHLFNPGAPLNIALFIAVSSSWSHSLVERFIWLLFCLFMCLMHLNLVLICCIVLSLWHCQRSLLFWVSFNTFSTVISPSLVLKVQIRRVQLSAITVARPVTCYSRGELLGRRHQLSPVQPC